MQREQGNEKRTRRGRIYIYTRTYTVHYSNIYTTVVQCLWSEHKTKQQHSQPGGQVAGRVILVADDVVALVDGLEEGEGVAHAEELRQAAGQQLAGRGARRLADLRRQLLHQRLLAPLDVRLHRTHTHTYTCLLYTSDAADES